jgi:hypothetical protein
MPLSSKQEAFILEYLKDFNGTQAAIRAKYTKNPVTAASIAYENLRKPQIIKRIDEHLHVMGMNVHALYSELLSCARSDMADYIDIDEDTGGVRAKGLASLIPNASRAIKKVKEKRVIKQDASGKNPDLILDCTFEFELHNKLDACKELLNRIDKIEELKTTINGEESGFVGLPGINADSL